MPLAFHVVSSYLIQAWSLLQCKIGAGDSVKFQQLELSRETETHIHLIFKLSSFLNVSPNKNDIKFFKILCNLQITRIELFKFLVICFRLLILLAA